MIYNPPMNALLVFVLAVAQQAALETAELEEFLRTAEVVAHKDIGVGVTLPMKLELSDGQVTLSASWKTVDERRRGIIRLADGTTARNFRDSYEFEIAAYELDKLIGTKFGSAHGGAHLAWKVRRAAAMGRGRDDGLRSPGKEHPGPERTAVESPGLQHSALPVPHVRHRLQERTQHAHRSGLATLGHR